MLDSVGLPDYINMAFVIKVLKAIHLQLQTENIRGQWTKDFTSATYFIEEVNPSLAKAPLGLSDGVTELVLTSECYRPH